MAEDQREQRANSMAISRQAAATITTVVSGLILLGAGALFRSNSQLIHLTAAVEHLEEFGPGSGKRFTAEHGREVREDIKEIKEDAKLLRTEIRLVRQSCTAHRLTGAHADAERRLNRIEKLIHEH